MRQLGMIIIGFKGELRFNGKIIKCGTGSNDHMRIKLRKRKAEQAKEWWMTGWLEIRSGKRVLGNYTYRLDMALGRSKTGVK